MVTKQLSKRVLRLLIEFCKQVHEKRKDRDNNNNDSGPHRLDRELVGKIGELCYAYKLDLMHLCDMTIYERGQVKLGGDLGKHIHVKTCHIKYKGTDFDSWLVDINDAIYLKPSEEDLIYLAYANEEGYCEMIGHVKATDVYNRWEKSKKLAHKRAIYLDDIKDLIHEFNLKTNA